MPKLLTPEEAKAEALPMDRRAVLTFRNRFRSKLDPTRFFKQAAHHCGVPNKLSFQAELVRACYPTIARDYPAYVICSEAARALLPEQVKAIKRIARGIRREIAALSGARQHYRDLKRQQRSDYDAPGLERKARRHWQELRKHYRALDATVGPQPAPPLAPAFHILDEVRVNLATSSSSHRYEEAIRDLDHLLDNWSKATGLKQGVRLSVRELDGLIARLAWFYAKTTGQRPRADKHFKGLVELVVDQLPYTGMTVRNSGDQARLKKRIQENLRHTELPTMFQAVEQRAD